jgi:hypothetical protein
MAKDEGGKGRMAKGEGNSKNQVWDVFRNADRSALRLELGRFGFPFAFRPLPFAKLFA